MPDVFISYSVKDEELAQHVHKHLIAEGLNTFLASISLRPGEHWTPQILEALRNSEWVFLLASKNALASPYVQQEIGGAVYGKKKLVPIMWDIQPKDLPRWIGDYQGLMLSGTSMEEIKQKVAQLASNVKASKIKGQLVVGVLILALCFLAKE